MIKKEFAEAAEKVEGMNAHSFLTAILCELPDREGRKITFPGQGASSHTVIIGDEVFKTARIEDHEPSFVAEHRLEAIEIERAVLSKLGRKRGMPVPRLTYEGQNFPFFGMTRLSGECLTAEGLNAMPEEDKKSLAKEVARLCVRMTNEVSEEQAQRLGLSSPGHVPFEKMLGAMFADPRLKKFLGDDYGFYKKSVEEYLERHGEKYADGKHFFMHGDLHEGNIFYDPRKLQITGVIDFGAAGLTLPESGFFKLYESYPADFVDAVLKEYSRSQETEVTRRDIQLWNCVKCVMSWKVMSEQKGAKAWEGELKGYISQLREEMTGEKKKAPPPSAPQAAARIA